MGWALDGGEDIGGDMAYSDYLANRRYEINEDRYEREHKLKGKYLIICSAPSNGYNLYLQDRNISRNGFWTKFKSNALGFDTEAGANKICKSIMFNNPRVICNK